MNNTFVKESERVVGGWKVHEDKTRELKLCISLMICINIQHIDCNMYEGVIIQLSTAIVDCYLIYDMTC